MVSLKESFCCRSNASSIFQMATYCFTQYCLLVFSTYVGSDFEIVKITFIIFKFVLNHISNHEFNV